MDFSILRKNILKTNRIVVAFVLLLIIDDNEVKSDDSRLLETIFVTLGKIKVT